MRRPVASLLVGLGAFLLGLVPLTRLYLEDEIVAARRNFTQTTRLETANATYFDTAELRTRTGVTLVVRTDVHGDVGASADGRIAVWDSTTAVLDRGRDRQIDVLDYRFAFDRRTGGLVGCCGAHVAGDTGVRFSGYGLVLPPGAVRRRDYPLFDVTTRRAWTARYDGTERVHGLLTYRFVQDVGPVTVARMDSVPGRLLGLGRRSRNVPADRHHTARITLWVDPRTGVPVKRAEAIRDTLRTPDGRGRLTAAAADLVTVPSDQERLVARSDRQAFHIELVRTYVPAGAVGGGIVLIVAGVTTALIGRRSRRAGASGAGGGPPDAERDAGPGGGSGPALERLDRSAGA